MPRKADAPHEVILREARAGNCPTPLLIQGEEDYRVEEMRRRVLEALFPDAAERSAAVETVSAKEISLAAILERASAAPLFAARRAIVVKHAEVLARPAAATARAPASKSPWETLPPGAIVILVARPSLDARTRVFRDIEARGKVLTFDRLRREREVAEWIDTYLCYWKSRISAEARSLLIENTLSHDGVSLVSLARELDKLRDYVGDRARIERADVETLVEKSAAAKAYELGNAISDRSVRNCLLRLAEFLERGESVLGLLALLSREYAMLLEARIRWEQVPLARKASQVEFPVFKGEILPRLHRRGEAGEPAGAGSGLFGRHPYAVYVKLRQAEGFTVPELLRGIRLLARADRELKSSGLPERLVMESLLIRLVGEGTEAPGRGV